jgi:alkylation response protein AidB-like acyl-CoA dehydrogenase
MLGGRVFDRAQQGIGRMNFGFTEEQELLREQVRRVLNERSPMSEVRKAMKSRTGYSATLWKQLAELGWPGLVISEQYGGSGLGWVDLVVLLEESGRALLPSPLLSNTLAALAIERFGTDAQKAQWLPALADGSKLASVAYAEQGEAFGAAGTNLSGARDADGFVLSGQKVSVPDPESAALFVVTFRHGDGDDDLGVALVPADAVGLEAKAFPLIDETKRMGTLSFDDVPVGADVLLDVAGRAGAAVERLCDEGAAATTAEMTGATEAAIELTVEYAGQRVQFGQPIGHFQGVKHPLAEMHTDNETCRSLLYYAAWALDGAPDEVSRAVSLAKAYATESLNRTGTDSIQLHGAVGFTTDQDIHLYYKRSKWARPMFGDADMHYERVITLRGL